MAEKRGQAEKISKARGGTQQGWLAYIMESILSLIPGTRSLRTYLFGPQRRKARRKQKRKTNKTFIRKVVGSYWPRNKAGELRFVRRYAQPAQFFPAAARKTKLSRHDSGLEEGAPQIANLRDVMNARLAEDDLHAFTHSRLLATSAPSQPATKATSTMATPPGHQSDESRGSSPYDNDLDDLSDILAALAMLEVNVSQPAPLVSHSPKAANQQKAAEQLSALLGGLMAS